jgi:hypothetical protein
VRAGERAGPAADSPDHARILRAGAERQVQPEFARRARRDVGGDHHALAHRKGAIAGRGPVPCRAARGDARRGGERAEGAGGRRNGDGTRVLRVGTRIGAVLEPAEPYPAQAIMVPVRPPAAHVLRSPDPRLAIETVRDGGTGLRGAVGVGSVIPVELLAALDIGLEIVEIAHRGPAGLRVQMGGSVAPI